MEFFVDLEAHEWTRIAHVLNADVVPAVDDEQEALRTLYADLDPQQEATLALLREAGVLCPIESSPS